MNDGRVSDKRFIYKKKNVAQIGHKNSDQLKQTDGSSQFVFSSISKSVSGGMDGGGSNGAQSSRENVVYEGQSGGTHNEAGNKFGSTDTTNGGDK